MTAELRQKLSAYPGVHVRSEGDVLFVEPVTEHDLIRALTALRQSQAAVRLSLVRMARIASFNDTSLTAKAEAGAPMTKFELAANRAGMTLGVLSPGAMALSVGEFLEGPYAGLRAIPGGRLETVSMALRVVTPDALATASHMSPRSAAGPDLDALYLGAERRFGLITQATLRLLPNPSTSQRATFSFATAPALVRAVIAILQDGVLLSSAAIERRAERYVLSVQLHGTAESIERDLSTLGHRVTDAQGRGAAAADSPPPVTAAERSLDWRELRGAMESGQPLRLWRIAVDGAVVAGATAHGRLLTPSRRWPKLPRMDELSATVDVFGVMRNLT